MKMTTELVDILRNLHDRIGKVELDSFSKEVRQVSEDLNCHIKIFLIYC